MNRTLDVLSDQMFAKTILVLARLTERGVPVMIVQTLRTLEEHTQNLANGTSRVSLSKHLSRSLRGLPDLPDSAKKCDAIDLCPFEVYQISGPDKLAWNTHTSPETLAAWRAIGEEGEAEDLRWGGRWNDPKDPGHLELIISPDDRANVIEERQRVISI